MHQTFNLVKRARYLPGLPFTNMNNTNSQRSKPCEALHRVEFKMGDIWVPDGFFDRERDALHRAGFVLEHMHDHVRICFPDGTFLEDTDFAR